MAPYKFGGAIVGHFSIKKSQVFDFQLLAICKSDSAGIQTLDLQNRNLTLYSAKLRSHHKKCVQNYIKKTKPTNSIAQKLDFCSRQV